MVWKPIKDVTFTSSLSYNYGFVRRDYLRDRSVVSNNRSDAFLNENNSRRWEIENYATWNKEFGARKEHTVSVLVGQGAEEQVINTTTANANGIPFDAIRIISGVPNGANSPYQPTSSKPGTDSAIGGISGASIVRARVVTPRVRNRPPLANGCSVGADAQMTCTCPPIRSLSAMVVPLYGT